MHFTGDGRSLPDTGGSSGADFIIGDTWVQKRGDERVGVQGAWLEQHATLCLPIVFKRGIESYHMERLNEKGPSWVYKGLEILDVMFQTLDNFIWNRPPRTKFDKDAHEAKLQQLFNWDDSGEIVFALKKVGGPISWDDLPTGLTHGDPTWDNVMFRGDQHVVLIDPIPSTPAVPDLRCVDLGKMMQSVHGYEGKRYGAYASKRMPDVEHNDVIRHCADKNEARATCYWHLVHLLRALPYMPKEVRNDVRQHARAVARSYS